MNQPHVLPHQFADLEHLAREWALPTEKERYFKLLSTSIEELRAFYAAVLPRAQAIVDYITPLPADQMPGDARALCDLLLTFVETAYPIELKWKQTNIEFTVEADRMQFHGPSARSAADRDANLA